MNSVFSLTWRASTHIYWNKRKRLHKKRVQLPPDWFGTQIWPPWRHVKTHNRPFQSCPKPLFQSEAKCEGINTKNDFFFSCILDPSAYGFGNALLISLLYMRRKVLGRDCFSCKLKLIFKRKVLHFAFFWKWEFLELGDGLVLAHSEYRYTKLNKGFIKKRQQQKRGVTKFPSSCYMLRDNFSSICDCWSTCSGSDYKQNKTRITFVTLE